MAKKTGYPEVIGWRERISLPEFGIEHIPAKIDTGARTAALHAVDQTVFEVDGERWVEFMIPVHNRRSSGRVRTRVVDEREIKNTGGIPERRLIVRTQLLLGRHRWLIDVSLANRAKMEFDLILGRTAIRRRGILVDPGHSYLLDARKDPKKVKSKTRSKDAEGRR
ncbi:MULTISPECIES: RimK/LysX family protein [unclassified Ruegeria]|uniref:ATP-dependent zinc protease family protein n=1 Tax=unclassified Ruegeria TaxID=2625375 RepID=UPI001AEAB083|nr:MULTISPECIES: RimK/LysX family protein [unclassified Ruegeria]